MPSRTAPQPALPSRSSHLKRIAPHTLIVAVGLVAYSNSFHGPFIYDDHANLQDNPHIRRLWPLTEALSAPDQSSFAGRPILALSFGVIHRLFGLDVRGYHAINLLIHLLAGLALYGVVRRTLAASRLRDRFGASAAPLAAVIAALWIAHPLQTGCVTYITQRAESLAGLFYLLTLYAVIRAEECPRRPLWQTAAILTCALGMATKEVMATAPIVVLCYDAFFMAGSFRAALRRRAPLYAGLAATWLLLAILMAGGPRSKSVGFHMPGLTPLTYALTQAEVILHYLRLAFWPRPLCFDYEWPVAQSLAEVWPAAVIIALLLAATSWLLRQKHPAGFAGLWFLLILAPTSSFVPLKEPAVEYRVYLSLAGLIALVVLAGYRALRRWPKLFFAVAFVPIVAATCGTILRNQDYRTELDIWQVTVPHRPQNAKARSALGTALLKLSRHGEAAAELEQAKSLNPLDAKSHYNLGIVYAQLGRHADSIAAYREAIRLRPSDFPPRYNLANLLKSLGHLDEAVTEYRAAILAAPNDYRAHFNLALVLQQQGKSAEAADEYRAVLRLKPDQTKAREKLEVLDRSPVR